MIAIYDFIWKRLIDYGKKFQSGQDAVDEFNTRIKEVQLEVANDLSPFYQVNELVRGVLNTLLRSISGTSNSSGVLSRPVVTGEKFMRILGLGVTDNSGNYRFEITQSNENEIAISQRIPQRRPDLSKKIVNYIPIKTDIQLYPKMAIPYYMYYLIYPLEAKIAFTYTDTQDEDVMTYDSANSTDLAWDDNASNIILYKMLEKYGIVNREGWLAEYAKLGLDVSMWGGK
jgi:hypothetical protein